MLSRWPRAAVVAPASAPAMTRADDGDAVWRRALGCCPCVFRARKKVSVVAASVQPPQPVTQLQLQTMPLTIHDLNKFNNNENEGPRIPQLSFPIIALNKSDSSDSAKNEDLNNLKYSVMAQRKTEKIHVIIKTADPQPDTIEKIESGGSPRSIQEENDCSSAENLPTNNTDYLGKDASPEMLNNEEDISNHSDKNDNSSQRTSRSNSIQSLRSSRSHSAQSSKSSRSSEELNENQSEPNLTGRNSPSHSIHFSDNGLSPRSSTSNISIPHSPEPNENTFRSVISPEPQEREEIFKIETPRKPPPANHIIPSANHIRKPSAISVKTREKLLKCNTLLESKDWEDIMNGLKYVHLLLEDPQININGWRAIIRNVSSQVRCLRSQVARAACNSSGSLFKSHGKLVENEAEDLIVPLLDRTADTNRFIRADANEALEKICSNISSSKALSLILTRGCNHRSGVVRGTSAQLLVVIVSKAGASKVLSSQRELRERLLRANVDLLTDAMPETRARAKDLMRLLASDDQFFTYLKETITPSKYKSIEKTVNALRSR